MNATQKQAQALSKKIGLAYAVYVPDQGEQVFTEEQMAIYGKFVMDMEKFENGNRVDECPDCEGAGCVECDGPNHRCA